MIYLSKLYVINNNNYIKNCDANLLDESIIYSNNIKNCPEHLKGKKLVVHTKICKGIKNQLIGELDNHHMTYRRIFINDGIWVELTHDKNNKDCYIHEDEIKYYINIKNNMINLEPIVNVY